MGLEQRREVDALEFTRGGEQVVLGARGRSISAVGDEPLGGQIFNVFTLRAGRIVRIDPVISSGNSVTVMLSMCEPTGLIRPRPPSRSEAPGRRRVPDPESKARPAQSRRNTAERRAGGM